MENNYVSYSTCESSDEVLTFTSKGPSIKIEFSSKIPFVNSTTSNYKSTNLQLIPKRGFFIQYKGKLDLVNAFLRVT